MDLIKSITNLFTDKLQTEPKKLDSNLQDFQTRIDIVVTSLLKPYHNANTDAINLQKMVELLDPSKCNDIAIALASNLQDNYTELQLRELNEKIYMKGKKNELNTKLGRKDESKQKICQRIATHYIKLINLIAAILTAVNPRNNVCLNRLNSLFTELDKTKGTGVSKVCNPSFANKLVIEEPGMKELLILYYYYMINKLDNYQDKLKFNQQFQMLSMGLTSVSDNLNEQDNNNNNGKLNLADLKGLQAQC